MPKVIHTTSRSAEATRPSATDMLIHQWVLRMLVPLGGYREFLNTYGFGDEALAIHLGLADPDVKFETPVVLATLRNMHQKAERSRRCPLPPPLLAKNVERVGRLLELDAASRAVLTFAVLLHSDPWLHRAARQIGRTSGSRLIDVLTGVLGIERAAMRTAMAPAAPLHESGLLRSTSRTGDELADRLSLLSLGMADRLLYVDADPIDLLSDIIVASKPPRLSVHDFDHLPTLGVLLAYLRESLATSRQGVNVLIYGQPGTGKTQLAAVVAQSLGRELFEVTAQDAAGHSIDGESRLRAYGAAQGMLRQRKAVLLFDETEDVFSDGPALVGGRSTGQSRKAWMNRTLETNPAPAFWLTNSVRCIDPAFVRRFDLVLEAALPTGRGRQVMLERACGQFIEPKTMAQVLDAPRLAPAVLERAASVINAVRREMTPNEASQALVRLIDSTLVAQGHRPLPFAGSAGLSSGYDPLAVATDVELERLTQGLLSAGTGRLCLYGPPGTGKTAYGRWLAQQLDRPLHAKRVSDIVTPYVGETEQNLARCFRRAADEGAVLLIDEVDGFLRDRRHAQRSWEVTAVNEMLVQMETFEGLFIASTNLMSDLDPAALRRFDLKVKFDYLRPEQAWRLLQSCCLSMGVDAPTGCEHDRLTSLVTLTPGDFAAVERQHRFRPFSKASAVVLALTAECAIKRASASRPIGFVQATT